MPFSSFSFALCGKSRRLWAVSSLSQVRHGPNPEQLCHETGGSPMADWELWGWLSQRRGAKGRSSHLESG